MNKYSGSIEDIFDQCLVDSLAGKPNASQFLSENPEYRDEFEPLISLTNRLNQGRELIAPTEFRASTLARFNDRFIKRERVKASPFPINDRPVTRGKANQPIPPAGSKKGGGIFQRRNRTRFFATLSISLIVLFFILSSGVVLAANNSIPGGTLYPLKMAVERSELTLSKSELGDQQLHLKFAERRLIEVDRLLQQSRNLYIDLALNNYRTQLSPLVTRLASPDLDIEDRARLANLILRSSSIDELQLQSLYQRIPPEQRALIKLAIEEAQAARKIAIKIVDTLPDLRTSIRTTLESTLGLSNLMPTWPTVLASQRPGATSTPTPNSTNFGLPNPFSTSIELADLPYWLTITPDWSQFATLYPSIYPTLANLVTSFPLANGTLQPPVIPTIIFPSVQIPTYQFPTPMPIPPIPSFVPPMQVPTSLPIPQIPTPPVIPTR